MGRDRHRAAMSRRRTLSLALAVCVVSVAMAAVAVPRDAVASSAGCGASDPIGARLPVLFVHGFNASAKAWSPGTLSEFCTARTYSTTFDYGPWSNEWVTDSHIGPALAGKILDLANASKAGGGPGKVLVVAHSMGGLAVRCAADGRCNGDVGGAPAGQPSLVAKDLAGVVTFDTPNLGSFLRGDGGALVADSLGDVLSDACDARYLFSAGSQMNSVCDEIRVLATSHASRGFTPGSSELNALPDEPAGVPVLAVAGQVAVQVSVLFTTAVVSRGTDLIVGTDSALAQSRVVGHEGGQLTVDCGIWNVYGSAFPDCWHLNETNNPKFLAAVTKMINGWFTDHPPPATGGGTGGGGTGGSGTGGGSTSNSGPAFTLSPTRGRPGTRVSVGHITNCPATPSGKDQGLDFVLVDAAGKHHDMGVQAVHPNGFWYSQFIVTIPDGDGFTGGPTTAAAGAAKIIGECFIYPAGTSNGPAWGIAGYVNPVVVHTFNPVAFTVT